MNKIRITAVFVFLIISAANLYSQYANYRIYPSGRFQIEPSIVRHPLNEQILFASAYTIQNNLLREGVYISTNGGLNWIGSDEIPGIANQSNHAGDPGPIIDKDGRFILTHQGAVYKGMYSVYSTNGGAGFTATTNPIAQGDQDKGSPLSDISPASPFYGRTYLSWTRYVTPFPIVIAYTTNGAVSWSGIIPVNNSYNGNRSYGPSIGISPAGTVYVTCASAITTSPYTEDAIGFAKSSNGGVNWQVTENAFDCNGIRTSQLEPWTIRANSFPAIDVDRTGGTRNGWIYIVTTNKNLAPAGSDPDIVFHRSTNDGATWSAGVRVNQDPINNGRNQFFPAIRVDEGGGINVLYYDGRNSPDSVDVYISRSVDGGITWSDHKISENRFRPASITGTVGNMGDNIGITSGNGKLYPVWMSNQSGILQVWTAIVDYNTIGIEQLSSEIPNRYVLEQNYPNPFNPSTKIKFSLTKAGFTSLKIYDISGRLVKILAEQEMKPGEYSVSWDAAAEPSGVYFYTIETAGFKESRKMILVK